MDKLIDINLLKEFKTKQDEYNKETFSETGTTGADGKSAYEIAKDNGFDGTETEWLESLKGVSPQFLIGNIETLDSNQKATVDITGTFPNYVLNFGIPKGENGILTSIGGNDNIYQLSFLNLKENDVKYLNIDIEGIFDKFIVQAYKFISGESNIVQTIKIFDNTESENFNYNPINIEFSNNGMKIKDIYELSSSKYNEILYITDSFNKEDFVELNQILIS